MTQDDLHFPNNRLPTTRMVLRALKFLNMRKALTGRIMRVLTAQVLFPQIDEIYGRAGVPLISLHSDSQSKEKIVCNKLVKIMTDDKNFRKQAKS